MKMFFLLVNHCDEQTKWTYSPHLHMFTERYLTHHQCLWDLVKYWFRVSGDLKHKLLCDLVMRGCLMLRSGHHSHETNIGGCLQFQSYWNTQNQHLNKRVFIPEPLSVIINTWALGQHLKSGAWNRHACTHTQTHSTWTSLHFYICMKTLKVPAVQRSSSLHLGWSLYAISA